MGPRLSASILSSPRYNYFCNQAVAVEVCRRLIVLLGCTDQGLVDNNAMAWNAAITGSIFAEHDACLVTKMALPFGSTRASQISAFPHATARSTASSGSLLPAMPSSS
jgi:hypothetical protein